MKKLCLLLIFTVCLPVAPLAGPVADGDRIPLDLRRTTLVVRDIEKSLALYRDALGMQVAYDTQLLTPRNAKDFASAEKASRLVLLRANDNFIGMLGLLEYQKPRKEEPALPDKSFTPGSIVLLFNSENLDETFARAAATESVVVVYEPELVSYPAYSGDGEIRVRTSGLRDPDGFTIELNQLLDDIDS